MLFSIHVSAAIYFHLEFALPSETEDVSYLKKSGCVVPYGKGFYGILTDSSRGYTKRVFSDS
jgi:hypothetical protein